MEVQGAASRHGRARRRVEAVRAPARDGRARARRAQVHRQVRFQFFSPSHFPILTSPVGCPESKKRSSPRSGTSSTRPRPVLRARSARSQRLRTVWPSCALSWNACGRGTRSWRRPRRSERGTRSEGCFSEWEQYSSEPIVVIVLLQLLALDGCCHLHCLWSPTRIRCAR